jgi:hypothetical protein
MRHEAIEFDEAAIVEQDIEPFACRQFAFVVLGLDAGSTSALLGFGASLIEQVELVS